MNVLGWTITRRKDGDLMRPPAAAPPAGRGGWYPIVKEPFTGAWQRNLDTRGDSVLTYGTVFACVTLIASDIAKLWLRLMAVDADGIWSPADSPAFSPVLRKPNRYQNRITFFQQWMLTKLMYGNVYALKERDARGVVRGLSLLDPARVKPLVTSDGGVYYQLSRDDLAQLEADVIVPAREIIHDLMYPLFHPLIGVSPLQACGLAAMQGLKMQQMSAALFANGGQPGGLLTAPGVISPEAETQLRANWDTNYAGADNVGALVILGNGMHYEPLSLNAVDAQLIDQLKWTGENICSTFHVPPYMVGLGGMPTYNNIEALNQQYYAQCLQILIEALELSLDEGLELPAPYGTEFDLDALLRMDTATAIKAAADGINAGFLKPNEARAKFDLTATPGGDTPYLQQQYWPLSQLAARPVPVPTPAPAPGAPPPDTAPPAAGTPGAAGKDGAPGPAGADGLGFDDLEEIQTDDRTIVRRYRQGDRVKEFAFSFPIPLYRGVYMDGQAYARGDMVTKGGSLWHCNGDTITAPETAAGAADWTLCVKRGQAGKNAAQDGRA